jgi:uncharacterized protein
MAKRQRIRTPVARTVMWTLPNEPGSEIVHVTGTPGDGWRCRGHVHLIENGDPVRIAYLVLLEEDWTLRYADVELYRGPGESRYVQLLVDPDLPGRGWQRREATSRETAPELEFEPLSGLDDIIDIDMEFTPLTNTLPIRRLAPRVGQGFDVTAAWVRFPSLTVEPLSQHYERTATGRYHYSAHTGYETDIEVDDLGLVVRYGDVWERVASVDAG